MSLMIDRLKQLAAVVSRSILIPCVLAGCVTPSGGDVMFQAMVEKAGDSIEIQQLDGATIFLVTSPAGIGTATIKLWQGQWPSDVRVRLRYAEGRPFTRVEGFTCTVGKRRPEEIRAITYLPDFAEVKLSPGAMHFSAHEVRLQWVDYHK